MTRPQQRNKAAKIEAILQTAMILFRTQGYPATTTNQIAAEAGVSIGLLYKYFPGGKPEIARRTVENIKEVIVSEELGDVTIKDASVVLRRALLRFIRGHREVSPNLAAFEIASFEDPETEEVGNQLYTIGQESILTVLKKLAGQKTPENLERWASVIFHVIDSVTHRHVLHGGLMMSDEMLADFLVQIIVRSIPAVIGE